MLDFSRRGGERIVHRTGGGADATAGGLVVFSPLPPTRSGVADYMAELLPALGRMAQVTVVVASERDLHPVEGADRGQRAGIPPALSAARPAAPVPDREQPARRPCLPAGAAPARRRPAARHGAAPPRGGADRRARRLARLRDGDGGELWPRRAASGAACGGPGSSRRGSAICCRCTGTCWTGRLVVLVHSRFAASQAGSRGGSPGAGGAAPRITGGGGV